MFDLGTGLRYFGRTQPCDGTFDAVCLLTHLHWDHTQGLPFFPPLLRDGARLEVYAPTQDDGDAVVEKFRHIIAPPMFPVPLDHLSGTVEFHDVGDATFDVGSMRVTSRFVPHNGPTLGYRVEGEFGSIAYIPDHQQPQDGSLDLAEGPLALARGVDYLIHDAQYTPAEFAAKRTWGHCTVDFALQLAIEAQVGTLVLFHHDPGRDDHSLDIQQRTIAARAGRHGIEVRTARESMVIDLVPDDCR